MRGGANILLQEYSPGSHRFALDLVGNSNVISGMGRRTGVKTNRLDTGVQKRPKNLRKNRIQ